MHEQPEPAYVGHKRRDRGVSQAPPPGQMGLVLAGLLIGILLMSIQLWLLTIALDLYLGGAGRSVWQIALVSGTIFLGGLVMLRVLRRRPWVQRSTIDEAGARRR